MRRANTKIQLKSTYHVAMARTRGPTVEAARRSSRLAATRATQPSQPPSKPARGRGPSSRGGRLAHAVHQQKGCGVNGQPSLSPSFSVATDSPPSPPSSSPSRPLPVPCHSSSPPVSHAGNDVQPSSPPAAVSSPVARAPLRPQRYFSAPKSSRPPFLLPSPPISSLVLPSSPQSLLSSKSLVLLCLILTLVLLLVSAQ